MDTVAQLCEQLASPDQVKAYQARRALAMRVAAAGAPGKEAERLALAAELAAEFAANNEHKDDKGRVQQTPRHSAAVRGNIARALADIGGEAEVAALAAGLADFDVREMARFALDRMPCAAAGGALADAARQAVGDEFRAGVLAALARRGGMAVAVLTEATDDRSPAVRLAAAEALAATGNAEADVVLAKVADGVRPRRKRGSKQIHDARLELAESLVKSGRKDAARDILKRLTSDDVAEPQRSAAKAALAQLG